MRWQSSAGTESGAAVVYFHGTPASKDPTRAKLPLVQPGFRLLTFDRPGYGGSDTRPGLPLTGLAQMVLDDLSSMGVERASLIGWSGGGPHALACAAICPERIATVCLINSWAPMSPPHNGLPLSVRFGMRAAAALPRVILRSLLLAGGQNEQGMVDDMRRVAAPWGFDVNRVAEKVPVYAWHCADDHQVPVAPWHGFPTIQLTVVGCASHEVVPELWSAALEQAMQGLD